MFNEKNYRMIFYFKHILVALFGFPKYNAYRVSDL